MKNNWCSKLICFIAFIIMVFSNISAHSEDKCVSQLSKEQLIRILLNEDLSERHHALKELYENSEGYDKFSVLPMVCKSAIMVDNVEDEKKCANILLNISKDYSECWNYGDAIHDGNMILGMVALKEKNISDAKMYLLRSAKTLPSPQLKIIGPSLMLADALIEQNEFDTVIEYFIMIKDMWEKDDGQLDSWISTLEKGAHPYLKQHLIKW